MLILKKVIPVFIAMKKISWTRVLKMAAIIYTVKLLGLACFQWKSKKLVWEGEGMLS